MPCAPGEEGGSLGEKAPLVCQQARWADIIYLPGTRTFWLLTDVVSDILMESAEDLRAWVQNDDPGERLRRLSADAGLMESLLPARAENFLNDAERQHYQACFERLVEMGVDSEASLQERIVQQHTLRQYLWDISLPGVLTRLGQRFANPEGTQLLEALRGLYQQGVRRGEEQGYSLEGEDYYGPWEAEIQQALETYRTCRAEAQREYHFNPGGDGEATPFSLQEVLGEYQTFIQLCESMPPAEAANECRFIGHVHLLHERQADKYTAYLNSILALAALGIATPELALSAPGRQGHPLRDGIDAFDAYCRTLKEGLDLHHSVEGKLHDWEQGTAGNTQLPIFLFEQERQRYEALQQTLDALYERAEEAVHAMSPGRVLIWHTDIDDSRHALGYEKRRIELLVLRNFPLREFSTPLGERSLDHVSLRQLMPAMTGDERQRLERALTVDGVLPATLWDAPETALSQWLARRGCQAIAHQLAWHDEPLGFFQPERFFAYLDAQGHQIDSLSGAARTAWGAALQGILFTGPSREALRLFDASAQAQMLRLVGMARHDLYTARGEEARDIPWEIAEHQPSLSFFDTELSARHGGNLSGGTRQHVGIERPPAGSWVQEETDSTAASLAYRWMASGTFSLARGELPLGRLVLPHPDQAVSLQVTLSERDERRDLGRHVIVLDAVARGFAGASLALASEVGFSFDSDGLGITGIDWVKREAQGVALDAFAGARLGIETRCALHWEPPLNLQRLLPQRAAISNLGMQRASQSVNGWRRLGMAALNLEGSVGLSGKLGLALGMHNGRFVLRVAARVVVGKGGGGSLAIELDVDSLDLWLVMLHRAMVDNNYVKPEWIDDEAYQNLGWLGYLATTTLLNVGLLAAQGKAGTERLYTTLTGGQRAGPMAYVLVNDPRQAELKAWIQQLTPEALGALLHLLASTPRRFEMGGQTFEAEEALDFQQIAIATCLGWIVEGVTMSVYGRVCHFSEVEPTPAQYLFTKAVVRMTQNGQPASRFTSTEYLNNRDRLDRFMARVSGIGNTDIPAAKRDYRHYAGGLGVAGCLPIGMDQSGSGGS